ncbi:MAG TPA: hypothetical protein VEI97_21190, partial [bacterium]|nr:hypothetical protein [bacterium]
RWLALCCALWALLPAALWAAPVASLDVAINTPQAMVGDQVEVTVTAELTATQDGDMQGVTIENLVIKAIPGLTLLPDTLASNEMGARGISRVQRFLFRADKPGEYQVGPVEFAYRAGGGRQVIRDPGPTLLVQDPHAPPPTPPGQPDAAGQGQPNTGQQVLDQDAQQEEGLRDIKGVFAAPFNFNYLFIALAALLLLALAWILYALLRKKPEDAPAQVRTIVPPVGLLQRTLQRLEAIPFPATLEDEQAVADYYLAITNLAKEYLGERYGLDAQERTSWELRQDYRAVVAERRREALDEFLGHFQSLFELCDGGKYAHLHATYPLMEEAKRRGRAFLEADHRLPGGGVIPIGVADPRGLPHLPDEPGLDGAAAGMAVKGVRRSEAGNAGLGKPSKDLPRATRMALDAVQSPSTSSTLFTAADSTDLVNRLAGSGGPDGGAPPPPGA